jgi:hypothetical protein
VTATTYRVVMTDETGTHPSRPMPRQNAIGIFGVLARGALYAPDGGGRLRVVSEKTWAESQAIAERAAS